MGQEAVLIRGTVRDGVVVPSEPGKLPEGSEVMILLNGQELVEIQKELQSWDVLSEEAWKWIDELEKEHA